MPAGYSGTPLSQKLGIKPSSRVAVLGAPAEYRDWLAPVPAGATFTKTAGKTTDIVHLFVTKREALATKLAGLRHRIPADAAVWVSWPKKSSGLATTVTEDVIREVALPLGLVDIKVCAVTEVWSGLKLVIRKELRR